MHDNKYIRFYSMHDIPSISIFTKKKKNYSTWYDGCMPPNV